VTSVRTTECDDTISTPSSDHGTYFSIDDGIGIVVEEEEEKEEEEEDGRAATLGYPALRTICSSACLSFNDEAAALFH